MKISAKSPCRVDLAGGTLDIWPLYLYHPNAVTVNFAVDRYTTCELKTRSDTKIILQSADQGLSESFDSLAALESAPRYQLPLLAYVIRFFRPQGGFEMSTDSEAPSGAGISGSSSLIISISSVLNKWMGTGYTIEKIREISQNIEAQIIRVPTGCQDYYPAMYGGVSAIQLGAAGIMRRQIPVDLADLNERFVLAYTGEPRNSGINNWEVTKAHINGDRAVHRNFARIATIACGMRAALESSDWDQAARLLREEWTNRKKNAPGITTPLIDKMIEVTRKAGSKGAKVCGAGGGGCVFFLVDHGAKQRVSELITQAGGQVLPVNATPQGVRIRVSA